MKDSKTQLYEAVRASLLEQENVTMMQLIRKAERDGHLSGMESSASYVTDAAKKIGQAFDLLDHEEKKVLGKSYYEKFLKTIKKL